MHQDNKNGEINLGLVIFEGRHYVGEISQDKKYALRNTVEFIDEKDDQGEIVHQGMFLGDLFSAKLNERLAFKLNPMAALYNGWFKVIKALNEAAQHKHEEVAAIESEISI